MGLELSLRASQKAESNPYKTQKLSYAAASLGYALLQQEGQHLIAAALMREGDYPPDEAARGERAPGPA